MKRLGFCLFTFLLVFGFLGKRADAQSPDYFSGFYGGFFSGYVGVDDNFDDTIGSANFDIEGWINGLTAGYNHKHDRFLIGVEVDGAILEAGDRLACPGGGTCEVELSWLGTARGRVGYLFGDELEYALYVTGGVAVLGVGFSANLAPGSPFHYHETGFVVGGGGEAYLFDTSWISTKIEYLYVDFGDGKTSPTGTTTAASLDLNMHILKVGLNLHF